VIDHLGRPCRKNDVYIVAPTPREQPVGCQRVL
jgi:hypothetical protein